MTNAQCRAYAVIALRNLIKAGIIKAGPMTACHAIKNEIYLLLDEIGEEEAEERAYRILRGDI